MTLKEYAKLNDITLADAKKRTGLTHWKQIVNEEVDVEEADVDELVEDVVEVVEAVVELVEDVVDMADKIKSVRGLGTKSPYWSELRA